jgi:hypothetical protein
MHQIAKSVIQTVNASALTTVNVTVNILETNAQYHFALDDLENKRAANTENVSRQTNVLATKEDLALTALNGNALTSQT